MIEKTVYDYLKTENLPVYMEDPAGAVQPPYYLILKTGGGVSEHIGRAIVAIQSFGSTLYEAAAANETLKAAMEGLIELDEVTACALNSDYNYTDTARKRYRYQAVFEIIHY